MSLDVYLTMDGVASRAELDDNSGEVFERNITHNLGAMADLAGVYKCCWRPDEVGLKYARQLIEPLRDGLARLLEDPDKFKALNPDNRWGNYEGLVDFVRAYLAACEQWPDATVRASC